MTNELEPRPQGLRTGIMGPIGAGKSTLARVLGERWSVNPIAETLDNPYLPLFYKNPREWSFKLEELFLQRKIFLISSSSSSSTEVIDPALEMDELFPITQYRMGWMTKDELKTLQELCLVLKEAKNIQPPDIFLVVNAPLNVLLKRIEKRGRKFEQWILDGHTDYVEELQLSVLEWVEENRTRLPIYQFDSAFYDLEVGDKEIVWGVIDDFAKANFGKSPG